uniref:dTDP-4-dehydrorhamnose 3,5-epimerase n=1 Tax=Wuchereria bancrofti TaxID=6293 RepID=A0AAF5PKG1_WUCBA
MLRTELEIEHIEQIDGLKLIRLKLFPDTHGYFVKLHNEYGLGALGFSEKFKQLQLLSLIFMDNHSYSKCGVLRGLHAQPGMGKLVSVISGEIYDVAIDTTSMSKTFGKWYSVVLDEKTRTGFWIPDGFLHGFYVLSEKRAHVTYKCTAIYSEQVEFSVNPLDPELSVDLHINRSHQNLKCLSLKKE